MKDRCLIIAEAGVNHNGKLELAMDLCDAAKDCGADVIKFQTWKTEELITGTVAKAEYQKANVGNEESQFDMLKKLELSYDDFREIKKHCDNIGIVFASTADEKCSLDFLIGLGIPFIKIGSGDIANIPFLRYAGTKKMPIILSTGMSTLEDVEISIHALKEGGAEDISLLHCTTDYPCPYEDVNLNAMITLRDVFHLPVGYSDHTIGTDVGIAAVALGAGIIEKHFTLDRSMEGPDHLASTEPAEFKKLVQSIRTVEKCLGTGEKSPTENEKENLKVITKRIVARKEIAAGELFSENNICIKRNDRGMLAKQWDNIIGSVSRSNYSLDQGIIE